MTADSSIRAQHQRKATRDAIPRRIVSLVPSQTELLVDLGLEAALVGITKFCVHPPHLRKTKTVVGGTKAVHLDAIRALDPDIILCNKEENTQAMVQALETIAPVHVSDVATLADCLALIGSYGSMFSVEARARDIIESIRETSEAFARFVKDRPVLQTAYFIWKGPWMVAARQTFIDAMLLLNRFENYYGTHTRYPEVVLDAGRPETADLVLLSSEPFPFKKTHLEVLRPYFPKATFLLVDGEAFSWYGTRLIAAFAYFKSLHQGPLKGLVSR